MLKFLELCPSLPSYLFLTTTTLLTRLFLFQTCRHRPSTRDLHKARVAPQFRSSSITRLLPYDAAGSSEFVLYIPDVLPTMVFFGSILFSLALAVAAVASPVSLHKDPFFPPIPVTAEGLLCRLPIPIVQEILCPREGSSNPTVKTAIGTATGVADGSNAIRYAVRYGQAARWQPSSVVTQWQFPYVSCAIYFWANPNNFVSAGNVNASQLPLACPQDNIDSSAMSEDCLSMILYVPTTVKAGSNVPTILWYVCYYFCDFPMADRILVIRIHGGSFTSGSATGPGLDGSSLAVATNSIVAVVQYRLGAVSTITSHVIAGLAYTISLARTYGTERPDQFGHQGHHYVAELPPEGPAKLRRKYIQDHPCWTELRCQYDSWYARRSLGIVSLPVGYPAVGPNGEHIRQWMFQAK